MESLTFDQLPQAVGELLEKVSKIEDILNQDHAENKEPEGLFSITQAAKFLNLSISTIYGKVCRREIPVSKQGKRLYFNKTELLEWVKSGRKRTLVELATSTTFIRTHRH
ncbi:helix-turn-helix domain-containing protein [Mucilaginibacter ginkgonis]|uniref:Helix-turn-helix domain-containing protein n=1 Tax=Mucilaginibacter ginkgonis TaxID=2682091 RepID=A0A6I4HZV3_9SPHI|nr:helix-turn-helix domain-containing protein [Mucilaginibacter ginkgonis]QQL49883.1 helix-turn-helix domain-containing protein [Mucilaginibacter ginkgonis]